MKPPKAGARPSTILTHASVDVPAQFLPSRLVLVLKNSCFWFGVIFRICRLDQNVLRYQQSASQNLLASTLMPNPIDFLPVENQRNYHTAAIFRGSRVTVCVKSQTLAPPRSNNVILGVLDLYLDLIFLLDSLQLCLFNTVTETNPLRWFDSVIKLKQKIYCHHAFPLFLRLG